MIGSYSAISIIIREHTESRSLLRSIRHIVSRCELDPECIQCCTWQTNNHRYSSVVLSLAPLCFHQLRQLSSSYSRSCLIFFFFFFFRFFFTCSSSSDLSRFLFPVSSKASSLTATFTSTCSPSLCLNPF